MSSKRGLRSRFVILLSLAVSFLSLLSASAFGVTLVAPADVLDRTDVQASLTASDPAGLAMLYVDGSLQRSRDITEGPGTVTFAAVPLPPGQHGLRLLLRSRDGLVDTPVFGIMSWRKPMPPILLTPSAGYAGKTTPVVVKAGPSTSSLKITFNGTALGTQTVSPGQTVNFGSVTMAGASTRS